MLLAAWNIHNNVAQHAAIYTHAARERLCVLSALP